MMGNTNTDWVQMPDVAIVEQLGRYIGHVRKQQNKTQAQLAEMAGLNRWTISQFERGEAINLKSLIQILRALDSLHVLNAFEINDELSPLDYAKLKRAERYRVRTKNTDDSDNDDLGW